METQPKLLDVPISAAQSEAEIYADMAAVARQRQEELKAQAEIVLEKMEQTGQQRLSFRDEHGVRHTFEVVSGADKLRYTVKGEPAS